MAATVEQTNQTIYLAPLQGFTDFVYRKAYTKVFGGIDAFFIPYISVKNGQVLKKYEKEIQPENNLHMRVIPQILAGMPDEMLFLAGFLKEKGYTEINLNLGCPYPMVTNRLKGAGLLPYPTKIQEILSSFFEKTNMRLSVKLRAGLLSENEITQIVPVLNNFPLTEVILHPRVAKQLYDGEISGPAFEFAIDNLNHKLVYNGSIFSVKDFHATRQKFEGINCWMLGRGVLMNPFLPALIKGSYIGFDEKSEKLKAFHELVLKHYTETLDNEGNTLNKMKQFWIYFCNNFNEPRKCLKTIHKTKNLTNYKSAVKIVFGRLAC